MRSHLARLERLEAAMEPEKGLSPELIAATADAIVTLDGDEPFDDFLARVTQSWVPEPGIKIIEIMVAMGDITVSKGMIRQTEKHRKWIAGLGETPRRERERRLGELHSSRSRAGEAKKI